MNKQADLRLAAEAGYHRDQPKTDTKALAAYLETHPLAETAERMGLTPSALRGWIKLGIMPVWGVKCLKGVQAEDAPPIERLYVVRVPWEKLEAFSNITALGGLRVTAVG